MTGPFVDEFDYFDRKIKGMWFTGGQSAEFHTHGDRAGTEGVWNAAGQVRGIYDAQVKTTWKTGAFQDGSVQKAKKVLHRDMELGLHITETRRSGFRLAEENESEFRKIFDYAVDEWDDDPEPTTLHMETEQSGERKIDVLLSEAPICEPDLDPLEQQYFNLILKLRAGQPMWYEDNVTTDFKSGLTAAEGYIDISNPTDQPMRHKWIFTRGTWTVPDFSWKGGRYKRRPGGVHQTRTITLPPLTDVEGGAVVSLNSRDMHIRDVHYTNLLPLLGGQFFHYVIPPYTQRQRLPISYVDAPAGGALAQLVQPRLWSRPWGLE